MTKPSSVLPKRVYTEGEQAAAEFGVLFDKDRPGAFPPSCLPQPLAIGFEMIAGQ